MWYFAVTYAERRKKIIMPSVVMQNVVAPLYESAPKSKTFSCKCKKYSSDVADSFLEVYVGYSCLWNNPRIINSIFCISVQNENKKATAYCAKLNSLLS